MALLVTAPLTLGLSPNSRNQPVSVLAVIGACTGLLVYIGVAAHFSHKAGFPMAKFHKLWACLCLTQMTLAMFRLRQLRQPVGGSSWRR